MDFLQKDGTSKHPKQTARYVAVTTDDKFNTSLIFKKAKLEARFTKPSSWFGDRFGKPSRSKFFLPRYLRSGVLFLRQMLAKLFLRL